MYTVIKINKKYSTHLECVIKYFNILNILSSLNLRKGEVDILAFAAVYGNIGTVKARDEFCKTFTTSKKGFDNYMYNLIKRGFLQKEEKKVTLNKQLHVEHDIILKITLCEKS